jgi:hypothetical protein
MCCGVIVRTSKTCRVVPLSRLSTRGDLTVTLSSPEVWHIFGGWSSVSTAKRDCRSSLCISKASRVVPLRCWCTGGRYHHTIIARALTYCFGWLSRFSCFILHIHTCNCICFISNPYALALGSFGPGILAHTPHYRSAALGSIWGGIPQMMHNCVLLLSWYIDIAWLSTEGGNIRPRHVMRTKTTQDPRTQLLNICVYCTTFTPWPLFFAFRE